jgi:competence protein ComEC
MTALALLAGALLGLAAADTPDGAWLWVGAALAIAAVSSPWRRDALLRVVAMLLMGLCLTGLQARAWLTSQIRVTRADLRVLLEARIVSVPERHDGAWRFDVEGTILRPALEDQPRTRRLRRLRLQWRDVPAPRVGESWRLLVRLMPLEQRMNFHGYDLGRQLFRDGLHAAGRVLPSSLNVPLALAPSSVHGVRARIAARVDESIADPDAAALVKALAVGLTSGMSADQWRVFNATGTTHLVAISGLHVTLFAWLSFRIARLVWRWLPWRWLDREPFSLVAGLAAAGGYALLAGLSVPTQRTWLMLATYVAGRLACRNVSPGRLWALALIAVLACDPVAPLSAGFWLSFLAVGVLLVSGGGDSREVGVSARLWNLVRTQFAVMLVLAPVGLLLSGSWSLTGMVVNLVAIPVISLVFVPVVLAGALASWLLPSLHEPLFAVAAALYETLWPALVWCADFGTGVRSSPPAWWYVIALPAALVWMCRWHPVLRLTAFSAMLPLVFAPPSSLPWGQARVHVLDAGRGSAVLVRTRNHLLLFDTGDAWNTRGSRLRDVVLPALEAVGARVHVLLLPGMNDDRARAAALLAFERGADRIIAGGGWPGSVLPVESCRDGRWLWEGVEFRTFVAGVAGRYCVLRVSAHGGSILLAGDVDTGAELALLARHGALALASDVALVSRHASASGSSPQWIEGLAARWVIAAGGVEAARSRAGVLDRWRQHSDLVLDTHRQGAIELALGEPGVRLLGSASEARYPFVWRRALRYDRGHVGNRAGRRPIHVADHHLLDRAGRYRSRTPLDPATQARAAARAHQEGLAARRGQPGQRQGHRRAGKELAAGQGAGRGAGQPPSRPRHHDGACRGRGPARGARARAVREFRGHHRQHLAVVRPVGHGHRHHRRLPGRDARRHG